MSAQDEGSDKDFYTLENQELLQQDHQEDVILRFYGNIWSSVPSSILELAKESKFRNYA